MKSLFLNFAFIILFVFSMGFISSTTMEQHQHMAYSNHFIYSADSTADVCLNLHAELMNVCNAIANPIKFNFNNLFITFLIVFLTTLLILINWAKFEHALKYIPTSRIRYRQWLTLFEKRAE